MPALDTIGNSQPATRNVSYDKNYDTKLRGRGPQGH